MSAAIRAKSACALFASALLSAASPPTPLTGTYSADCAPYDGSAFRITLPTARNAQIEMTANVDLADMAGRWVHSSASQPGTAAIMRCSTAPERICRYPQTGSFTITGKPGTPITGTFDARFDDGTRQSGPFRARHARDSEGMRCG